MTIPLGRLVCFGLSQASSTMGPSRLRALLAIARLPWFHPISLMNDNKAVVGATFPLVEAAKAHRYMQERQNVGKVVLTT